MTPLKLTDRQKEIVTNIAGFMPRGLRERYLVLVAESLREIAAINDRHVSRACNDALCQVVGRFHGKEMG